MKKVSLDKISINTVHYRYFDFHSFLTMAKKTGVRSIELLSAPPHCWIDTYGENDPTELLRTAARHGFAFRSLMIETSSMRYTLGSEDEFADMVPHYFEHCINFASVLGVSKVVIRANGFLLDRPQDVKRKVMSKMLDMLLHLCADHEMDLVLMNQYEDKTSMIQTLADMKKWLYAYRGSRILAGADICSVYESGSNIEEWLDILGGQLNHIHLSGTVFDGNRRGFGDCYLNGQQIIKELEEADYNGDMVLYHDMRKYWTDPLSTDMNALTALGLL